MTDGPVATFLRWLFESALPFWANAGIDHLSGGFHERFTPDGQIAHDPRRARVTGRQIYAFATAERLGWAGPSRVVVEHGLDFLRRHLCEDNTLVVPILQLNQPASPGRFDLYDQAFVLLGLATAASIGIEPDVQRSLARRLRDRMVAGWKHPIAGFEEATPRVLPLRSNPHMHMLEAALAWSEIDRDGGWDSLADEIVELCLTRFIDPTNGSLREYFDGDWAFMSGHGMDVWEPGHQFEWAWLLVRWSAQRNRADAIMAARRLIDLAEARGASDEQGLAINELGTDLRIRDARMRLWPQTERIKAHVALYGIARDTAERTAAAAAVQLSTQGLLRFLDHPVPGLWWEHLDPNGYPVVESARASSLYHLMCAAVTIIDAGVAFEA